MGTLITLSAYFCVAVFLWRVAWRILLLFGVPGSRPLESLNYRGTGIMTGLRAVRDILLLTRLFRTNKFLWVGEWLFHAAFILVLLRHIRYFVYPVPEWVLAVQEAGVFAGYLLPLSLLYVTIVKLGIEKKQYFSSYNFFLLLLIFILCATGIIMKNFVRPDLVDIKHFMLSALRFTPASLPEGMYFSLHFIMTLVFLVSLPSHIFTAPYTLLAARKREDSLERVMHGQ